MLTSPKCALVVSLAEPLITAPYVLLPCVSSPKLTALGPLLVSGQPSVYCHRCRRERARGPKSTSAALVSTYCLCLQMGLPCCGSSSSIFSPRKSCSARC